MRILMSCGGSTWIWSAFFCCCCARPGGPKLEGGANPPRWGPPRPLPVEVVCRGVFAPNGFDCEPIIGIPVGVEPATVDDRCLAIPSQKPNPM